MTTHEPGRCRTCRWWTPSAPDPEAWGDCRLAESDAEGEAVEAASLATAIGDPGASAVLVTSPCFGCIQWATKVGAPGGDDR